MKKGVQLYGFPGERVRVSTIQELGAKLDERDELHAAEFGELPDFLTVQLPEPEVSEQEAAEIFLEIRKLLEDLLGNTLAPYVKQSVPEPGQYNPWLSHEDLRAGLSCVKRMVSPNDPSRAAALTDREAGAIAVIRKAAQFAIDHGDAACAVRHLQYITGPFEFEAKADNTKMEISRDLADLPWELPEGAQSVLPGRKNLIIHRMSHLESQDYSLKNGAILNELVRRFPQQGPLLRNLGIVYGFTVKKFDDMDNFEKAQWFHEICKYLPQIPPDRKTHQMLRPFVDALLILIEKIKGANNSTELAAVIDEFVKKTIPGIFKQLQKTAIASVTSLPQQLPLAAKA